MNKDELMSEKTVLTFLSKLNKLLIEEEYTSDDSRDLALVNSCVLDMLAKSTSLVRGMTFRNNRGNPIIIIRFWFPNMDILEILDEEMTINLKALRVTTS